MDIISSYIPGIVNATKSLRGSDSFIRQLDLLLSTSSTALCPKNRNDCLIITLEDAEAQLNFKGKCCMMYFIRFIHAVLGCTAPTSHSCYASQLSQLFYSVLFVVTIN